MKRISTFSEFTNREIQLGESHLEEAVNVQALAQKAGKDEKSKDKLLQTLKQQAPSLADDPSFMKQFLKSIEGSEEKEEK